MRTPSNCRRTRFTHQNIEPETGGCGCHFGDCRATQRRWPAGAAVIVAVLGLVGCQTSENYTRFINSLVGKSESQIMVMLGQPSEVVPLPDGGKMMSYVRGGSYTTPAQENYSSGKSVNIFTGKKSGYASTYTYTPEQTVILHCTTRIALHRGIVDAVTFEGNHCVK